jgi:hypothetical protein
MTNSDCIDLIGVLGTWAVAILAIWGDPIRARLFRPTLRLDLLDPDGELIDQTNETGNIVLSARYYHVKLSNSRRFRFYAAREAQVLIVRVESAGLDGNPQVVHSAPLPLAWQNAALYPSSRTIGPEAIADLLYVRADAWLFLTPLAHPSNFPGHHCSPTRLWVTLQGRSIEADSKPLRVEIIWDGQWDSGQAEMRNHLRVSVTASLEDSP